MLSCNYIHHIVQEVVEIHYNFDSLVINSLQIINNIKTYQKRNYQQNLYYRFYILYIYTHTMSDHKTMSFSHQRTHAQHMRTPPVGPDYACTSALNTHNVHVVCIICPFVYLLYLAARRAEYAFNTFPSAHRAVVASVVAQQPFFALTCSSALR